MLEYLTNFDKVRVFKENKYLFIPYYVVEYNKKYTYYNSFKHSLEDLKVKYDNDRRTN